jgi:3-hydroxyisobutyrate dehydrogenase-like beta-hydroxyacid dehydrogenase
MIGLGIMDPRYSASLMNAGYVVVGYDVLANRRRLRQRAGGNIAQL